MIRFNGITIDAKTHTISHDGRAVRFRLGPGAKLSQRFRMMKLLILTQGITRENLFHWLNKDDPNGGALYGVKIIDAELSAAKEKFETLGLELIKWKADGGIHYRLAPIDRTSAAEPIPAAAGRSHSANLLQFGLNP